MSTPPLDKLGMTETDVEIGALELASGATLPSVVQRVTRYG